MLKLLITVKNPEGHVLYDVWVTDYSEESRGATYTTRGDVHYDVGVTDYNEESREATYTTMLGLLITVRNPEEPRTLRCWG